MKINIICNNITKIVELERCPQIGEIVSLWHDKGYYCGKVISVKTAINFKTDEISYSVIISDY